MTPRVLVASLASLIALSSGCLEELPDITTIDNLRVIGIQAQRPEVTPGESVTMELLAVDGLGRPMTLAWYACTTAERGSGFFSGESGPTGASGGGGFGLNDPGACIEAGIAGAEGVEFLGSTPVVRLNVDEDLFSDKSKMAALYGLPEDLDDSVFTLLNSVAGVNITVGVRITVEGDVRDAYKRVNVSTASDANLNPVDLALHIKPDGSDEEPPVTATPPGDGRCFIREANGPLVVTPGTYRITPVNVPDPQAEYNVMIISPDPENPVRIEPRDEEYFYSFFTTSGSFDEAVTKATGGGSNTLTLPADGPELVDVWIVNRDGRGGTTWCHSQIFVVPPPS